MKNFAIIIITLLLAITLYGCGGKSEAKKETNAKATPTDQKEIEEIDLEDFNAKKRYEEALGVAREWKADAQLYSVSIFHTIEKGTGKIIPHDMFYSFGSAEIEKGGLTVYKKGDNFTSRFDEDKRLTGIMIPVDHAAWNLDNYEAFDIAEEAGGRDFRNTEKPELLAIYLNPGEELLWGINYASEDSESAFLGFGIRASDGTVTDRF